MSKFNTDDYVTVPERIALFYERYPEGSFQVVDIRPLEVGGQEFLLYIAAAFRSPDDPRPAHGTAWEPVPGPTPFTRLSEAMNAETSAIGRACANLGIGASRSIASREDVDKSQAQEEVHQLKQQLVDLANEWAVDTDQQFSTSKELIEAFFKARGLTLPGKAATADDLRKLVGAAKEVVAA